MNTSKPKSKFSRFLRNNAALLLIIFCVLAILAVVLAVTLTPSSKVPDSPVVVDPNPDDENKPDLPSKPTTKMEKIYFMAPIAAGRITVQYNDGTDDALLEKNETLGWWCPHMGVDIAAEDGTKVTAMFDGTVVEADYDIWLGNYVKIDHGDNVIATYASLGDTFVSAGDVVKQGDEIGTVSNTASDEYLDGAHLHLIMTINDQHVNPTPYVNGEMYREKEVLV